MLYELTAIAEVPKPIAGQRGNLIHLKIAPGRETRFYSPSFARKNRQIQITEQDAF